MSRRATTSDSAGARRRRGNRRARPDGASDAASEGRAATGGRRGEIIAAAAELFDVGGYRAVSMEDIADAVGIRKPTLYHYFRAKDEILYEIYRQTIDRLLTRQERRSALPLDPKQELLEIMGDVLEVVETLPGHVRVFFEHHRELPDDRHEEIMAKRARYHDHAVEVIRSGIADGSFRSDLDPQLAALAIFGACNWAYQWYARSGELRGREIAQRFWDLFMRGMFEATAGAERRAPAA